MATDLLVVDASVLGALLFDEPRADEAAARLDGRRLVAPAILPFEIANVAVVKARRAGSPEAFVGAMAAFAALPITLVDVDPTALVATALRTGLTAYDAAYLDLARGLDADLATFDLVLGRAFGGGG